MKLSLPLKLGIAVLVLFGLLILGMVLWKPMKVRYYSSRLDNEKTRMNAVKKLLILNRKTVVEYYTDRYDPKDVKKRMEVVDELCACGDKGKAVMKKIFRNWACGPTQQVKIPAGTLTLPNGSKAKIKSLYVDKFEVTNEKYWVFAKSTGGRIIINRKWDGSKFINIEEHYKIPQIDMLFQPITRVTWHDAKAYADWVGMRLPGKYEWRYAARAGSTGKYCFGDNESLLTEYAWFRENSNSKLYPVGEKRPNKWSLFDVHGNASEWCTGDPNELRLGGAPFEGGCVMSSHEQCSFFVWKQTHGLHWIHLGFRCVRD
jgi:formylglycine-generating enzyme required for sulfatase activity